jgi:kynurenine formamidase
MNGRATNAVADASTTLPRVPREAVAMQSGWLQQFWQRNAGRSAGDAEEAKGRSRREFLQGSVAAGVTAGLAAQAALAPAATAHAAPNDGAPSEQAMTPIGAPWWPSRWGAGDEAGASNMMTPENVLRVLPLIKSGRIFELGRVYQAEMPLFGARVFGLRIPGTPSGGPLGANGLIYHDEFLATEIGQVGTQFDGLGHIGCRAGRDGDMAEMRYYNGFTELEMANAYGLQKLGMEKVKPFFTRGVLVDVAGAKGAMLDRGYEITLADVRQALARVGIDEASIQPGDAIFFNTGWGGLWMQDNARFNSGEPGIGLEVARWVVEKQAALVGADTWATEVVPNPDPNVAFVVHQELITKHGIFLHENMDLSELGKDRVYEFVYVFAPMRIKGGTGSQGRPIAIV